MHWRISLYQIAKCWKNNIIFKPLRKCEGLVFTWEFSNFGT